MKTRKRNEQHILYSLVMVIVFCLILWFLLSCIVFNLAHPELTKEEVFIHVIKNIL